MKVVLSLLAILAFTDATYNYGYGGGYRGYGGYRDYYGYRPAYGPFVWHRPGWGMGGVQPHYYLPTAPMPAVPMAPAPVATAPVATAPMPAAPMPAQAQPNNVVEEEVEIAKDTEATHMEKRDAEALLPFQITKTTPWKSFSIGFGGHGGYRHYGGYGPYGGYGGYRRYSYPRYSYPYGYGF